MFFYPIKMDKKSAEKILKRILEKEDKYYTIYRITDSGQILLSSLYFDHQDKINKCRDSPVYIDYQNKIVDYKKNKMSFHEWDLYLTLIEYLL